MGAREKARGGTQAVGGPSSVSQYGSFSSTTTDNSMPTEPYHRPFSHITTWQPSNTRARELRLHAVLATPWRCGQPNRGMTNIPGDLANTTRTRPAQNGT